MNGSLGIPYFSLFFFFFFPFPLHRRKITMFPSRKMGREGILLTRVFCDLHWTVLFSQTCQSFCAIWNFVVFPRTSHIPRLCSNVRIWWPFQHWWAFAMGFFMMRACTEKAIIDQTWRTPSGSKMIAEEKKMHIFRLKLPSSWCWNIHSHNLPSPESQVP